MKKISIKRKALTCLSTAALLAAMAPGVALAETGSKYTSDIIVNGVQAGDTVTAYELVDSVVDANNNKTNTPAKGLEDYPVNETNADVAKYVANKSVSDLTKNAYTHSTQKATSTSVTFKDLDDGAWLIVVTNAEGHTRIYKNTVVNNDAKAVNGAYAANSQTADVKSEDTNASKTINNQKVQLGQTYTFTVNFAVPSFAANTTKKQLTVTDTPTGFTDVTSTIVVKNGDNTVDSSNYTVTTDEKNPGGFTISFKDAYIADNPNQQLTMTYSAKVTSVDALTGKANNHVTVNDSDADVNVQTYGYEFKKVGDNKALKGATFTLYDAQGNEVKDANGKTVTSTSDDNGYVYFTGLAAGAAYTAKETTVPAGFQKADDVKFTVNADTFKNDNPATPNEKAVETNFGLGADVTDPKQGVLPTTGGAGTIGLTVAGVVLVAGGATLVLRARKNNA